MNCRITCPASTFLPWGLDTLGRIYGFISFNLPTQEHSTFVSYFLILVAKDMTRNWRRHLPVLQFGGCSSLWRGRNNSRNMQWLFTRVHSQEAKMTGVRPPQRPLKAYSCWSTSLRVRYLPKVPQPSKAVRTSWDPVQTCEPMGIFHKQNIAHPIFTHISFIYPWTSGVFSTLGAVHLRTNPVCFCLVLWVTSSCCI